MLVSLKKPAVCKFYLHYQVLLLAVEYTLLGPANFISTTNLLDSTIFVIGPLYYHIG